MSTKPAAGQAGQVARVVHQHLRFVLQLHDLLIDLLQGARGLQDVSRVVGRVVDDPPGEGGFERYRGDDCGRAEQKGGEAGNGSLFAGSRGVVPGLTNKLIAMFAGVRLQSVLAEMHRRGAKPE